MRKNEDKSVDNKQLMSSAQEKIVYKDMIRLEVKKLLKSNEPIYSDKTNKN